MNKDAKKNCRLILFLGLLGVGIIGYFDAFAPIPYLWKASGKCCLFLGIPLIYGKFRPGLSYRPLFRLEKQSLRRGILLGVGVFSLILGTYVLLGSLLDLSAVTGELEARLSINAGNFLLVALYIATCNSFLEEFFFRGFLFFRLKEELGRVPAHLLSALLFSVYHVAIMVTWFDAWVFVLCLLALVVGGVLFNLLDEPNESLYPSWLTHGCANLAINSIGMILFYG